MKAQRNADLFTSYCVAMTTAADLETIVQISEQFSADKDLTENQKDALEALGVARQRILEWGSRGNA